MKTKDALHFEAKLPISESVRKRNPHLYPNPEEHSGMTTLTVQVPVPPKPKRIRQSSKPLMNKLETEYFEVLKQRKHIENIRAQSITFRLANGCRFTPDLTCNLAISQRQLAIDVKGEHAWEDALVKIKVAASTYPEIQWFLVWKENGVWQEQAVLP